MNYIEPAIKFFQEPWESLGVIFHCDADGVCSAAQILKYLKTRGIRYFLASGELEEKTFKKLEGRTEHAVILDLPADYHASWLKIFSSALVVDHHIPKRNLNRIGIAHVNPRFENPEIYISASEVCYEICKRLGLKKLRWLARIGACGDKSIKCRKKEQTAVEYINAVKVMKGENALPKIAEFLSSCEGVDEFISKKSYQKLAEKLKREVEKWISKFEPKGDVCFYEIDSPYSIISIVANELFERYPDKTIIVYGFKDNVFKVSARSAKYNLGKILHKAALGIGKGGGHERAAGARIEREKLHIFIARLKKFLRAQK